MGTCVYSLGVLVGLDVEGTGEGPEGGPPWEAAVPNACPSLQDTLNKWPHGDDFIHTCFSGSLGFGY